MVLSPTTRLKMAHKVIKIAEDNLQSCVDQAIGILKNGHSGRVIAVPTDTIYGLAGPAQDDETIKRIYEIKGRKSEKPLAICLSEVKDISRWALTSNLPKGLLERLFPGPVTVVLPRSDQLNPHLNPGVTSVG